MKSTILGTDYVLFSIILATVLSVAIPAKADSIEPLKVIVNSNQDTVARDEVITLREAIALVNGQLKLMDLSASERRQVSRPVMSVDLYQKQVMSSIEFQLAPEQTTIRLQKALPVIAKSGLVINGNNGFNIANSIAGFSITASVDDTKALPSTPTIAIVPEVNAEVDRGLIITSSGVTVKNLAIAGFTTRHRSTTTEPPADIFITAPMNLDTRRETLETETVPQDVTIENNWLGRLPQGIQTPMKSAFGVYIFNGNQVTVRGNTIADHDGSALITSIQAQTFKIQNNVIEKNGFAGMPDALRIEGDVMGGEIAQNTIQNNAGSAVYLFNPKGYVTISKNKIQDNGQRYQRAAIYVTGLHHQVIGNQISKQSGAGVVVAAYPTSYGNRIQNNQFSEIQGLAIDLVSQMNTNSNDYQNGDGSNITTDSRERGEKTGNAGANAPVFASREFFVSSIDGSVELSGTTLPNADLEIYQVEKENTTPHLERSVLTTAKSDGEGKFSVKLGNLKPGDRLSATVTTLNFGTSEMAKPVVVRSL